MKMTFDEYTRRARLQPALITALPLCLATLAWFPTGLASWGIVWSLIVWSGGTALLAQLGRELGKRKEAWLFATWGGMPTTRLLRHRDAPNREILARRHHKLKRLMPGVKIGSPQDEALNPKVADEAYESCAAFLREKTRDKQKFSLVFDELCSYGFRRNLWGMKPIGLAAAIVGTVAVLALVFLNQFAWDVKTSPLSVACGGGNVLLLFGWLFVFTPAWIKTTADAYAECLLASCETL